MEPIIQITHFLTGSVLFEFEAEDNSIKRTVEEARRRGANLQEADLQEADLQGANLWGAKLQGANLQGAKSIPQSYINICSRDMLFIFEHLKAELPFLRERLIKGEVDGTQYAGECACLIGSLGKANGGVEGVCAAIPYYEKGLENPGEQWFWQIREGDTPKNNFFAKHALALIDQVLGIKRRGRKLKAS